MNLIIYFNVAAKQTTATTATTTTAIKSAKKNNKKSLYNQWRLKKKILKAVKISTRNKKKKWVKGIKREREMQWMRERKRENLWKIANLLECANKVKTQTIKFFWISRFSD